ncbi:hypothetical protein [Nonomuraea wenchangensis]|uniref:Uncharacterized protein n=1 Tax=Nonomuraea wenchangensis TaxID=568860 RepID=A0A1I0L2A9_9ACTN|nr:hypothetical protein [Nonomuraea wenchangensis]SEU33587.1 hypothetical protein SAMN05421811_111206 [Nonomuraea wenchangensis]
MTRDRPGRISPGDIYEDCSFHPVLCTFNDGDQIEGISLIDASMPRACSLAFCGVIKLSIDDVVAARTDWPAYVDRRKAEFEQESGSEA